MEEMRLVLNTISIYNYGLKNQISKIPTNDLPLNKYEVKTIEQLPRLNILTMYH